MFPIILRFVAITLIIYAVIIVLAWKNQERLAFPGPRSHLPEPAALGFPEGELVSLITSDSVDIGGWFLTALDSSTSHSPGMIWFYGNMETVDVLAPILRDLKPSWLGLLIINYRGYGESDGRPTEEGLYRDAEAAWRYMTERHDIDSMRIAVYGRSVGSAVALYLANENPVKAIILDSPISSAQDMADIHYRLLPKFLLRLSLDNIERATRIDVPLLVFHGTDDRIAPVRMGRAVAEAGRARELVLIEGAGHNDMYDRAGTEYREKMHAFLAEHL